MKYLRNSDEFHPAFPMVSSATEGLCQYYGGSRSSEREITIILMRRRPIQTRWGFV